MDTTISAGDTVEAVTDYATMPQHPDLTPRMAAGDRFEVVEVGDHGNAIGIRMVPPLALGVRPMLQYVPVTVLRKVEPPAA